MSELLGVGETLVQNTVLEVKSLSDLREEDVQDLERFKSGEFGEFMAATDKTVKKTIGSSIPIYSYAMDYLKEAREKKHELSLILAKDSKGQVVGFSYLDFDLENPDPFERVKHTFLGVKWDQRRRGIGSELLKKRLDVLRDMGIEGYRSDVQNNAVKVYEKLGIKHKAEPMPSGATNINIAKQLTVYTK